MATSSQAIRDRNLLLERVQKTSLDSKESLELSIRGQEYARVLRTMMFEMPCILQRRFAMATKA